MNARTLASIILLSSACSADDTDDLDLEFRVATATEVAIVGAVTTSTAKVGFRTSEAADVEVEYADNPNFNGSTITSPLTTASADDFTGVIELTGLAVNDQYWYRLLVDDVEEDPGWAQRFYTFPTTGECTFAIFADVANRESRAAPQYQDAMGAGQNDDALFALQIGDMDHDDPATLADKRDMHRRTRDPANNHGGDFAQWGLGQGGMFHIYDDHDAGENDIDRTYADWPDTLQAFDEYWPTPPLTNSNGRWYSFTCSDHTEIFVLDTRSQRDDMDDTDDADKSMLDGAELSTDDQKTWLLEGLRDSSADWKIVISSVTANVDARPNSDDHWGGFTTEADEIADWISGTGHQHAAIDGVVMISADLHTGGGIDDGSNNRWDVVEMNVPHTNLRNGNAANLGTWTEGVTAGTQGRDGYGLVTATSTSLTLEAKDDSGGVRHSLVLQ